MSKIILRTLVILLAAGFVSGISYLMVSNSPLGTLNGWGSQEGNRRQLQLSGNTLNKVPSGERNFQVDGSFKGAERGLEGGGNILGILMNVALVAVVTLIIAGGGYLSAQIKKKKHRPATG